jgi:membrane associated rhomboid family serine protease
MLIPWRSDAPVYHRPWGTGGLIVLNILIHLWASASGEAQVESLILHYGTINPIQWVTHIFLHAGWVHLAGNMMFLWVFGTIVEGKIGLGRFLAVYGGIAVVSGLIEQVLMLGATGGSLGASGVLFGLMAMAFIWAPENEVDCILFLIIFIKSFELRVRTIAIIYVIFEGIEVVVSGLKPSSGLLHLLGVAVGLPTGIIMLKRGYVDCEGWDWYSIQERRKSGKPARSRTTRGASPTGSGEIVRTPKDTL